MRCQPLRRALVSLRKSTSKTQAQGYEKSAFSAQVAQLGFLVFLDAGLVERVKSSVVSKSPKTSRPRCFNVVGCSTLEVWFHKNHSIAVIALSLLEIR